MTPDWIAEYMEHQRYRDRDAFVRQNQYALIGHYTDQAYAAASFAFYLAVLWMEQHEP